MPHIIYPSRNRSTLFTPWWFDHSDYEHFVKWKYFTCELIIRRAHSTFVRSWSPPVPSPPLSISTIGTYESFIVFIFGGVGRALQGDTDLSLSHMWLGYCILRYNDCSSLHCCIMSYICGPSSARRCRSPSCCTSLILCLMYMQMQYTYCMYWHLRSALPALWILNSNEMVFNHKVQVRISPE